MSIEAMKQALDALETNKQKHDVCEDIFYSCPFYSGGACTCGADKANAEIDKAIAAIREALAQPEQELVCICGAVWDGQSLVSTPPQRKPLTEREILDLLPDAQHGWTTAFYGKWVARAVERAHGIKENKCIDNAQVAAGFVKNLDAKGKM